MECIVRRDFNAESRRLERDEDLDRIAEDQDPCECGAHEWIAYAAAEKWTVILECQKCSHTIEKYMGPDYE